MLNGFPVYPVLPASDIDRARTWYEEKLGMKPEISEMGSYWYQCGAGTWFLVYPTQFAGSAENTAASFSVREIEQLMDDLRQRGVVFEDYDFGETETVDGLLEIGDYKTAWFKDSEGNIIEISQPPA